MSVRINGREIYIEDKSFPLVSGEFHYWRNNVSNWEDILNALKQMGVKIIATYIPWSFHEVAQGRYDFCGETDSQRDLIRFIELTQREGFYLIVRPGPYIYSEWPYGGPPSRAARYHKLHPKYLEMAKDYVYAVSKVIKPNQVHEGGNIILVQVDNEPYPPTIHDDQMGFYEKKGIFKEWLQDKYSSIQELNNAWSTHYSDFHQACAFVGIIDMGDRLHRLLPDDRYNQRFLTYQEFKEWYICEIVRTIKRFYEQAGIRVPFYTNCFYTPYEQHPRKLREIVDLVGLDMYPTHFFEKETIHQDEFCFYIESIKMSKCYTEFCYIPEFESGIWHGWHDIVGMLSPEHYSYVALVGMAYGLTGWNYYMTVNRDNWYMAPINEWGQPRPGLMSVFSEIFHLVQEIRPGQLQNLCRIGLYHNRKERIIDGTNFKKMVKSLLENDSDFEIYDIDKPPQCEVLFYGAGGVMDEQTESQLVNYLSQGGNIVFFSPIPTQAKRVQIIEPNGIRMVTMPVSLSIGENNVEIQEETYMKSRCFFNYNFCTGTPIVLHFGTERDTFVEVDASLAEKKSCRIGYSMEVGKGTVTVLGVEPCSEAVFLVLKYLGVEQPSQSMTPQVLSTLHRKGDTFILFVVNRSNQATVGKVCLNLDDLGIKPEHKVSVRALRKDKSVQYISAGDLQRYIVRLDGHDVKVFVISYDDPS